jgi:hypothetical protein
VSQGVNIIFLFSPIHKLFYGLAGYWGYQRKTNRWCLAFIQRKVRPPRLLFSTPLSSILSWIHCRLICPLVRFHPVTHPCKRIE